MSKKKKSNPHDPLPIGSDQKPQSPTDLDAIDEKLQFLNLKYSKPSFLFSQNHNKPNTGAKLYLHIGGSSPNARWITSEKLTSFSYARSSDYSDDDATGPWFLIVGPKIRALVGPAMQLKPFPDQRRVDFVADGVWALKFFTPDGYVKFYDEYQNCLFENGYGLEATEENRAKVFGKDFLGWARPEEADDSIWQDAEESFEKSSRSASRTPSRTNRRRPGQTVAVRRA